MTPIYFVLQWSHAAGAADLEMSILGLSELQYAFHPLLILINQSPEGFST